MAEVIVCMVNARFSDHLVASDQTHYWIEDTLPEKQAAWLIDIFDEDWLYENLPPDFTAIAALNAIHRGGYELIITSDRPAWTEEATKRWLSKWRFHYDDLILLGPGGKRKILDDYGPSDPAILIDDDSAKWETVARDGVQVWSPTRPWTPENWQDYENVWVFDSWDKVLERLSLPTSVPIPNFSRGMARPPANEPRGGTNAQVHHR